MFDIVDVMPEEAGASLVHMTATVQPAGEPVILGTQKLTLTSVMNPGQSVTFGELAPVVIDLRNVVLPWDGNYECNLELTADGAEPRVAKVEFQAVRVEPDQLKYTDDYQKPARS